MEYAITFGNGMEFLDEPQRGTLTKVTIQTNGGMAGGHEDFFLKCDLSQIKEGCNVYERISGEKVLINSRYISTAVSIDYVTREYENTIGGVKRIREYWEVPSTSNYTFMWISQYSERLHGNHAKTLFTITL